MFNFVDLALNRYWEFNPGSPYKTCWDVEVSPAKSNKPPTIPLSNMYPSGDTLGGSCARNWKVENDKFFKQIGKGSSGSKRFDVTGQSTEKSASVSVDQCSSFKEEIARLMNENAQLKGQLAKSGNSEPGSNRLASDSSSFYSEFDNYYSSSGNDNEFQQRKNVLEQILEHLSEVDRELDKLVV